LVSSTTLKALDTFVNRHYIDVTIVWPRAMPDLRRRWTNKKKQPAIDREIESGVDHMFREEEDVVSTTVGHTKEEDAVESVSGKNAELASENERLRAELVNLSLSRENKKLRAEIARLKVNYRAVEKKPPVRAQSNFGLLLDSCTMCRFPPAGHDTRDDAATLNSMVRDEFVLVRDVPPCDDVSTDSWVREVRFSDGTNRGCLRSKSERESRGRSRSRERGQLAKFDRRARSKEKVHFERNARQRGAIALPDCADPREPERETTIQKNCSAVEGQISTSRETAPKNTNLQPRKGRSPSRERGSTSVNSAYLQLHSRGRSRSRTRCDAERSLSRGRSRSKTRFSDAKTIISRSRRTTKSVKSDRSGVNLAKAIKRDFQSNALGRIDKIAARMSTANDNAELAKLESF
ncbi:hypothetical protein THAOC_01816, partial [Thalassiosira oceanica]